MPKQLLHQGPSAPNRAHMDVVYIFYSLMDVDFQVSGYSNSLKKSYAPNNGHAVSMIQNEINHVLVNCPNGKTYNLSLALKHANLEYFYLHLERDKILIEALNASPPEKIGPAVPGEVAQSLHNLQQQVRDYGLEQAPLLASEANALVTYQYSGYFEQMNALLRGQNVPASPLRPTQCILTSLLAVSGANKNFNATLSHSDKIVKKTDTSEQDANQSYLTRLSSSMPPGITKKMLAGETVHLAGLTSYTPLPNGVPKIQCEDTQLTFKIRTPMCERTLGSCVEGLSIFEKTLAPHDWQFDQDAQLTVHTHPENRTQKPVIEVTANRVWGVETESSDYFVELALTKAYEYLKNPYPYPHNQVMHGINRPNHSLSHHVRVLSYTEGVIEYFKKHAEDIYGDNGTAFAAFCENISANGSALIKIFLAFSRTGRSSELKFSADPKRYRDDKRRSADYLKSFLVDEQILNKKNASMWHDILSRMCEPDFEKDTPANDPNRMAKIFIHRIVDLSHNLDLPRCFTDEQLESALSRFVTPKSEAAFSRLLLIARSYIVATGNGLLSLGNFPARDITPSVESFIRCNQDPGFCLDICLSITSGMSDDLTDPVLYDFALRNDLSQAPLIREFNALFPYSDPHTSYTDLTKSLYGYHSTSIEIEEFKLTLFHRLHTVNYISTIDFYKLLSCSWPLDKKTNLPIPLPQELLSKVESLTTSTHELINLIRLLSHSFQVGAFSDLIRARLTPLFIESRTSELSYFFRQMPNKSTIYFISNILRDELIGSGPNSGLIYDRSSFIDFMNGILVNSENAAAVIRTLGSSLVKVIFPQSEKISFGIPDLFSLANSRNIDLNLLAQSLKSIFHLCIKDVSQLVLLHASIDAAQLVRINSIALMRVIIQGLAMNHWFNVHVDSSSDLLDILFRFKHISIKDILNDLFYEKSSDDLTSIFKDIPIAVISELTKSSCFSLSQIQQLQQTSVFCAYFLSLDEVICSLEKNETPNKGNFFILSPDARYEKITTYLNGLDEKTIIKTIAQLQGIPGFKYIFPSPFLLNVFFDHISCHSKRAVLYDQLEDLLLELMSCDNYSSTVTTNEFLGVLLERATPTQLQRSLNKFLIATSIHFSTKFEVLDALLDDIAPIKPESLQAIKTALIQTKIDFNNDQSCKLGHIPPDRMDDLLNYAQSVEVHGLPPSMFFSPAPDSRTKTHESDLDHSYYLNTRLYT